MIHGLKDSVVSYNIPKLIMKKTISKNIQIIYLKSSDHRLSKPEDLLIINDAITNIRYQIKLS